MPDTKGVSKAKQRRVIRKRERNSTVKTAKMAGRVCRQGWGDSYNGEPPAKAIARHQDDNDWDWDWDKDFLFL